MKRKGMALTAAVIVLALVLAGCAGNTNNGGAAASPNAASSPSAAAATGGAPSGASANPSPSVNTSPDGFVMGKVTAISGTSITLSLVNPAGTKTITADTGTTYEISGSTKTAVLTDIAVGDVITATLNGTTALKIIDDGPNVNPNPSSYISPSPSASASPSPSAS